MARDPDLPDLEKLPDARAAVAADAGGRVLVTTGEREEAARAATRTAATLGALRDLGAVDALGALESLLVRGAERTTVTVVRAGRFLQVTLDPAQATTSVERALGDWRSGIPWAPTPAPAAPTPPAPAPAAPAPPAPAPPAPVVLAPPGPAPAAPTPPAPAPSEPAGPPASSPSPAPAAPAPSAVAAAPRPPSVGEVDGMAIRAGDLAASLAAVVARPPSLSDPWALLRRTLVRGQLTEASALREVLGQRPPQGTPAPGAEPLDAAQRELGVDALLEGIGSVLSGDALGGLRILKEVAAEAQPNRSFRWLAMHWSTLGAVQCSNVTAGRWFARQAVLLARELDGEAQAVSHWAAAEVLVSEGEKDKALDWIAQARVRFERLGDTWGLGRSCFAEARILGAMDRDDEAAEAARRAWTYDPDWDEPPVFLARRALLRGALGDAEEMVRNVGTAPAERLRLTIQAVRQETLTQADAVELLRHLDAAPSVEAVRGLDRLARVAPRLPVPREALAWMLLKAGKYADAGKHFTALAAARLEPAIRSSVMLGLGCVAHAQQGGEHPEPMPQGAASPAGAADPSSAAAAGGAPARAGVAVFSGKLSVFAVPDLLEFLRGARRTGLLLCSAAGGTAALRFREGRIAGAASPSTPGVGELLIRSRKLSAQALQGVLDRPGGRARSDGVLGEVLVRERLVAADDVQRALREQVAFTIKEIIGWREGEFAFNREEPGGEAEIAVEVDPQEVLLNVLKDMDEAARSRVLS